MHGDDGASRRYYPLCILIFKVISLGGGGAAFGNESLPRWHWRGHRRMPPRAAAPVGDNTIADASRTATSTARRQRDGAPRLRHCDFDFC